MREANSIPHNQHTREAAVNGNLHRGGRSIPGCKKSKGEIWTTEIPEVKASAKIERAVPERPEAKEKQP